jgi:hypothetical protein
MATLTPTQLHTLKVSIDTNEDLVFLQAKNAGNAGDMAVWYNQQESPAYICWNPSVSLADIGKCMVGGELAALPVDLVTNFGVFLQFFMTGGVANANNVELRSYTSDIFLDANETYSRLENMYRKPCTRGQKLYIVPGGTSDGSSGLPGTLTVTEPISTQNIVDALALP